jgi:hypothetical protein
VTFDLAAIAFVWQVEDPKPIARMLVDRGLMEFVPESTTLIVDKMADVSARCIPDEPGFPTA